MVNLLLTGTQKDNELNKRHEKCDASPAEQEVHHAGEWASQVETVDANESEEEAQQNSGGLVLRVNLLLSAAVWAISG